MLGSSPVTYMPYWADRRAVAPDANLTFLSDGDQGKGWYAQPVPSNAHAGLSELSVHPAWAMSALAQNKAITDLNVSACDLSDAGFTALGQALRQNRTLTCLKLDVNHVSLDGFKAFKGCLCGMQCLLEHVRARATSVFACVYWYLCVCIGEWKCKLTCPITTPVAYFSYTPVSARFPGQDKQTK